MRCDEPPSGRGHGVLNPISFQHGCGKSRADSARDRTLRPNLPQAEPLRQDALQPRPYHDQSEAFATTSIQDTSFVRHNPGVTQWIERL